MSDDVNSIKYNSELMNVEEFVVDYKKTSDNLIKIVNLTGFIYMDDFDDEVLRLYKQQKPFLLFVDHEVIIFNIDVDFWSEIKKICHLNNKSVTINIDDCFGITIFDVIIEQIRLAKQNLIDVIKEIEQSINNIETIKI